jgi:hypothetical protein
VPKLNEIYGGNYMKAEDIKDKGDVGVTIERVSIVEMDDGKKKAVLHFKNSEKTLPLNVTNANMLEELLGSDDTDDWEGKRVCLYTCKVDFQGKRVLAIRIKGAPQKAAARAPQPPPPPVEDELDDSDIPFAWILPFVLPLTGAFAAMSTWT